MKALVESVDSSASIANLLLANVYPTSTDFYIDTVSISAVEVTTDHNGMYEILTDTYLQEYMFKYLSNIQVYVLNLQDLSTMRD